MLAIADAKGSFPGMLQSRTYNVVLVREGKGPGETPATAFDKVIVYKNKAVTVKIPSIRSGSLIR